MRPADARFRVFPQFEQPDLQPWANSRKKMSARALPAFTRDCRADRIARALAERRVLAIKEVLESFEFHARTRKRLRRAQVVDLCCGHGLTGMLYAMEDQVDEVLLVDRQRPPSHDAIRDAVASVVPSILPKLRYVQCPVLEAASLIAPGAAVLAVHACGPATDRCVDVALQVGGPIAAMPCCYKATANHTPPGIRHTLGGELAADIGRTYRLTASGLTVDWAHIPRAITPMNRVLVGWRPSESG